MVERFWARVHKTDECWEWAAGKMPFGYGIFSPGKGQSIKAHRFSWELHFGPIPDGLWILHHCDNPSCVRPDHLFLGTRDDNAADQVAKGRQMKGHRNGSAKLTEEQAHVILARKGQDASQVATEYGVSVAAVRKIWYNLSWRHLPRSD